MLLMWIILEKIRKLKWKNQPKFNAFWKSLQQIALQPEGCGPQAWPLVYCHPHHQMLQILPIRVGIALGGVWLLDCSFIFPFCKIIAQGLMIQYTELLNNPHSFFCHERWFHRHAWNLFWLFVEFWLIFLLCVRNFSKIIHKRSMSFSNQ